MSHTTTVVLRKRGKLVAPPESASGGEEECSGEKRARSSPTSAEQCEEFEGGLRPVTELFPGLPSVPGDEQAVPSVFEWTPELLNDKSVRVKEADHVGAPLSTVALMQWKAAMEKVVNLVRPALVWRRKTPWRCLLRQAFKLRILRR